MKLGIFIALASGVAFAPAVRAQTTQAVPYNASPGMTGTASASKEVKSRSLFTYAISVTDKDTWDVAPSGFPAKLEQYADTNMTATCTAMRSMEAGWIIARRGSTQDGTTTWDISGTAVIVSAPTTRIDDYKVVNNTLSPQTDTDVTFSQTVLISIVQSPPGN